MPTTTIPGLKLIRHNASGVNEADDLSFPWLMEATFTPPEFLEIAFVFMHGGSEVIVVRSMSREALDEFISMNDLRNHPRLRRITITGPEGIEEEITGARG
jgi:hypothetical protein